MKCLAGFIFLMTLVGCTTAPQLKFEPIAQQLTWDKGRGFGEARDASGQMTAALNEGYARSTTFIVKYKNLSKEPVTIEARDFHLNGDALEEGNASALDPEQMIDSTKRQLALDYASIRPSPFYDIYPGFLGVHDNHRERQERLAHEHDENLRRQNQIESTRSEINQLEAQRSDYEKLFLRKTTIKPGEEVSGLITFQTPMRPGRFALKIHDLALPFLAK